MSIMEVYLLLLLISTLLILGVLVLIIDTKAKTDKGISIILIYWIVFFIVIVNGPEIFDTKLEVDTEVLYDSNLHTIDSSGIYYYLNDIDSLIHENDIERR